MEGVGRFPEDEEPVVRFFEPAQHWPEALPVGSGRLGAMVFGGVESELVQLNGKVYPITTLLFFQNNKNWIRKTHEEEQQHGRHRRNLLV